MTSDSPSCIDYKWDAFVAAHPHGHILQTSRWARLKGAFGWQSDLSVLGSGSADEAPIRAGCSLLFRRLPWGQTLAYAPKGPVVDWEDQELLGSALRAIREVCRRRRAALLKVEPELPAGTAAETALRALGFRPSEQRVQPISTVHIDITGSEEDILAAMKSKWRYNIRLAERKGVVVRQGSASDLHAIQELMEVTGRRDAFGVHDHSYHAAATDLFMADGSAVWLLAEHDGQLLAAIAVFALGKTAWYMWGASADQARQLMPNHALQWAAIRWARSRGCAIYDLWGIPDEVGLDPEAYSEPESWGSGGLWGVYRFKQGFGGRVVRYTGAWDLPISGPGFAGYRLALRLRTALRKTPPADRAANQAEPC